MGGLSNCVWAATTVSTPHVSELRKHPFAGPFSGIPTIGAETSLWAARLDFWHPAYTVPESGILRHSGLNRLVVVPSALIFQTLPETIAPVAGRIAGPRQTIPCPVLAGSAAQVLVPRLGKYRPATGTSAPNPEHCGRSFRLTVGTIHATDRGSDGSV